MRYYSLRFRNRQENISFDRVIAVNSSETFPCPVNYPGESVQDANGELSFSLSGFQNGNPVYEVHSSEFQNHPRSLKIAVSDSGLSVAGRLKGSRVTLEEISRNEARKLKK